MFLFVSFECIFVDSQTKVCKVNPGKTSIPARVRVRLMMLSAEMVKNIKETGSYTFSLWNLDQLQDRMCPFL